MREVIRYSFVSFWHQNPMTSYSLKHREGYEIWPDNSNVKPRFTSVLAKCAWPSHHWYASCSNQYTCKHDKKTFFYYFFFSWNLSAKGSHPIFLPLFQTLICLFFIHTQNLCIMTCPKTILTHSLSPREDVSFPCCRPRSKMTPIPSMLNVVLTNLKNGVSCPCYDKQNSSKQGQKNTEEILYVSK